MDDLLKNGDSLFAPPTFVENVLLCGLNISFVVFCDVFDEYMTFPYFCVCVSSSVYVALLVSTCGPEVE